MRSGELAAAAGVSADTVRHYERIGLLPPSRRRANGYRVYSPDALGTILLVQKALAVGFTLAEIGVFLKERRRGDPPCKRVYALASARLADVERRIASLRRFRDEFRGILDEWNRRLAETPEGSPAKLLESLTATPALLEAGLREPKFVHRGTSKRRTP